MYKKKLNKIYKAQEKAKKCVNLAVAKIRLNATQKQGKLIISIPLAGLLQTQ